MALASFPIPCVVQTFEFDGGDIRASQQWGDLSFDSIPAAVSGVIVTPVSRTNAVESGQAIPLSTTRELFPVSLGGGVLEQFLGIQITWTDDYRTQSVATVLYAWQPSYIPKPETISNRFTDWDNMGVAANKYVQGFVIELDTFNNAKSLLVRNGDNLAAEQTFVITANGQMEQAFSFDSPFLSHMVRIEPQDIVEWRYFGCKWVYEATPEVVKTWQTQGTSFGLNGYSHIRDVTAAYASETDVTLTITTYDGQSPSVVIMPSTGGAYQKTQFMLTFNKGMLYFFRAASTGPFQLFLEDFQLSIGNWGRTSPYLTYRNLGGNRGDNAKI